MTAGYLWGGAGDFKSILAIIWENEFLVNILTQFRLKLSPGTVLSGGHFMHYMLALFSYSFLGICYWPL